ncbi:MAG: Hpt domain-containing protein [Sphingomonadales bacterium]
MSAVETNRIFSEAGLAIANLQLKQRRRTKQIRRETTRRYLPRNVLIIGPKSSRNLWKMVARISQDLSGLMKGGEKGVCIMTSVPQDGTSSWSEELYEDVLETVEDRLLELEDLIDVARTKETEVQAYAEIRRVAHGLKTLCAAYGLADIAKCCHSLEGHFEMPDGVNQDVLRKFMACLQDMLEQHLKP